MPKRKDVNYGDSDDDSEYIDEKPEKVDNTVKKRPRIKFNDVPIVNSIKDLIDLGKTNRFYKNINMIMLWDILDDLEELNKMIGMKSLKETIFYQIIYYLQNMHQKNHGEYLHTVIYGPPGTGKCLAIDTPLIMYDGSIKLVQDIKLGDILMGDDSLPRNVLSLAQGKEKMYNVKQTKGDNYIVNESHILSLKLTKMESNCVSIHINGNKYKKNDIVDISVLDYLKLPLSIKSKLKGFKVSIDFEKKDVPFDPYIIGLWLGDVTSTNTEIANLMTVFKDLNLTNNKRIPDIYIINDKNTRLKILAGLLDSDVHSDIHLNNCYNIIQKNKKLADDIVFLCRSLGFYVTTNTENKTNYYRISISGSGLENIPVLIRYKIASPIKQIKDALNTCIEIEPLEIDNYYGFTLDGNSRFLLGDFTVTHNTTVAKIIGNLYKNLQILSKDGEFKTATRDSLVAGYLGQSAIKTKKFLHSCIGGVMFIDEAYSLGPGKADSDSFSKEVIDTMCGFLSENKTNFCCIIAGYEKQVKSCFFSVNPGLERRFPWVHTIEEYTNDDLTEIFLKMIKDCNWFIDSSVEKKYISEFFKDNKELFKNAGGDVETFISKCKMTHSKRVFGLDKNLRFILNKEDIKNTLEMLNKHKLNIRDESKPPLYMYI